MSFIFRILSEFSHLLFIIAWFFLCYYLNDFYFFWSCSSLISLRTFSSINLRNAWFGMKSPLIQLSKKALHPYSLLSAVMDENSPWIFHFFIRSALAHLIHHLIWRPHHLTRPIIPAYTWKKRTETVLFLKSILGLPTNCAGKSIIRWSQLQHQIQLFFRLLW